MLNLMKFTSAVAPNFRQGLVGAAACSHPWTHECTSWLFPMSCCWLDTKHMQPVPSLVQLGGPPNQGPEIQLFIEDRMFEKITSKTWGVPDK